MTEYLIIADTQDDHLELHYHSQVRAGWVAAYLKASGYIVTIQVLTSGSL